MSAEVYRYVFGSDAAMPEVESALLLAVWATESIHGETQVRMDAAHCVDAAERTCVIDAGTAVGRDLNRLFTGFLQREFGADAFTVERVAAPLPAPHDAA